MLPARSGEDEHGRRYWALAGSPRRYRLMDAVRELKTDSWLTKGSDLRPGDLVVIWKYKGPDKDKGAIALGEVVSFPALATALEVGNVDYWMDSKDWDIVEERALVRYLKVLDPPFWVEGPRGEVVSRLSVSNSHGGTVFIISPEQWRLFVAEVGGWPDNEVSGAGLEASVHEVEAIVEGRATGQAFRQSAAERKAIEKCAMTRAISHYRSNGLKVLDVLLREPFDLSCEVPDGSIIHVEVKEPPAMGHKYYSLPTKSNMPRIIDQWWTYSLCLK